MPQLWQGSTLLWSLMGDRIKEDLEDDLLFFSGEETSLWDFPLWIFKPFSVHVVWLHMLKVVIPRVNMISASSMKLFVTKMRDCVCWDGEDLIAKILP